MKKIYIKYPSLYIIVLKIEFFEIPKQHMSSIPIPVDEDICECYSNDNEEKLRLNGLIVIARNRKERLELSLIEQRRKKTSHRIKLLQFIEQGELDRFCKFNESIRLISDI